VIRPPATIKVLTSLVGEGLDRDPPDVGLEQNQSELTSGGIAFSVKGKAPNWVRIWIRLGEKVGHFSSFLVSRMLRK